jgi:hypothetical protein
MYADVQKYNELPWQYLKDGNNSYLKFNSNGKIKHMRQKIKGEK